MALQVNKLNKSIEMGRLDIIKYQLFTYCYFEKIPISDAATHCLALLSLFGQKSLNEFCNEMAELKLFASPQAVRNTVSQQEEQKLIVKEGGTRKTIKVNPAIPLITEGNILLDFKILSRDTHQS